MPILQTKTQTWRCRMQLLSGQLCIQHMNKETQGPQPAQLSSSSIHSPFSVLTVGCCSLKSSPSFPWLPYRVKTNSVPCQFASTKHSKVCQDRPYFQHLQVVVGIQHAQKRWISTRQRVLSEFVMPGSEGDAILKTNRGHVSTRVSDPSARRQAPTSRLFFFLHALYHPF